MAKEEKKKKSWIRKLRNKYRLIIMNEETYEEKISFRLSRWNVFVALGVLSILLIVLTIYIIAFTPLREYIPGYMDVNLTRQVYELQLKADSIEREFVRNDLYLQNIKNIIEGRDIVEELSETHDTLINYEEITLSPSREDSLLRAEFENIDQYDLRIDLSEDLNNTSPQLSNFIFFAPLDGIITNYFNPLENHYGVDIVAEMNEVIKSTLDGVVVFSGWTVETGHVIAVQHQKNILSIYKHNSVLLKRIGDFVKAGEPIAIIGESGELSTGPHLHFELWHNGNPVNPSDYVAF